MRTTIDLPEDVHRIATSIARDRHETLSATVAALVRRGLGLTGDDGEARIGERNGFPVLHLPTGRIITTEDVKSLEDDE